MEKKEYQVFLDGKYNGHIIEAVDTVSARNKANADYRHNNFEMDINVRQLPTYLPGSKFK